jgi:hypothetical protein
MKRRSLTISLMLAGLISAAQPLLAQERTVGYTTHSVSAPDPAVQIRELARTLRTNDLAAMVRAMVPPANYQMLRQTYELKRLEPTTELERAQFAQTLTQLTASDAIDTLMAKIEPKLVEARPKAMGALMIGLGALQVAISSEDNHLSAAERASLQSAYPGIQQWASSTDFLSSLSMRQALTLMADAARRTGVRSLDDLKMLTFEQTLSKASTMLAAGKQALQLYGLDVNAITDSLHVQVLSNEGQSARVRTTVTVFGAPIASEHDLLLIDGQWYSKDATSKWAVHATKHRGS